MSEQLLRDPFYGQIVASVAVTTALSDRQAQEAGQKFTDSQVKAVFHRVIRTLEGKPPKPKEPTSEKERRQATLYADLLNLRTTIIVTNRETEERGPLPVSMFLKAMRAAKQSLERGRTGEAGERDYLDRAHGTLARVEVADQAAEAAGEKEIDPSSVSEEKSPS